MSAAIVVGLLVTAGVYLLLQRELVRAVLGLMLLGHAANVILLAAGGLHRRDLPLTGDGVPAQGADPLPQAFALTAIVITFAITVYLLVLALRNHQNSDGENTGTASHPDTEASVADTTAEPPRDTPAPEGSSSRGDPEREAS